MAFRSYCTYYLYIVDFTCSQITNFSSEHEVNLQVSCVQYKHFINKEYGSPVMHKNRNWVYFISTIYVFTCGCFKALKILI